MKQKKLTEEHKRKIGIANSIALKGRKNSLESNLKRSMTLKGRRSPMKGKKHPAKKPRTYVPCKCGCGQLVENFVSRKVNYVNRSHYYANMKPRGYMSGSFKSVKNSCNIRFQSSYELRACILFEHNNEIKRFGRCKFSINYTNKNVMKIYIPDFWVEYLDGSKCIVEVKPSHLVNTEVNRLKLDALVSFCEENGFEHMLLTEEGLE